MRFWAKVLLIACPLWFSGSSIATSALTVVSHRTGVENASMRLGLGPIRPELLQLGAIPLPTPMLLFEENGRVSRLGAALFESSFSGPISWTSATLSNGIQSYTLTGVSVTPFQRAAITRIRLQMLSSNDRGVSDLPMALSNGYTFGSVPEPSMFLMFLTGILGFVPVLRRKIF